MIFFLRILLVHRSFKDKKRQITQTPFVGKYGLFTNYFKSKIIFKYRDKNAEVVLRITLGTQIK